MEVTIKHPSGTLFQEKQLNRWQKMAYTVTSE